LAKELLDNKVNGLQRVRGVGGIYPPISDEVSGEIQAEIIETFNKNNETCLRENKVSLSQIAEMYGLEIPIIKRIIFNE
jgi:hypothetical protein